MSSATAIRVPIIVEWDDFLDAVRSSGGRGFTYGAAASSDRTCRVPGCRGSCGATTAPAPAPAPAPAAPAPIAAAAAAPVVVTAADVPHTPPEKLLYEFIVEKYYGVTKPVRSGGVSYEDYKRWETRQDADYLRTTTPYGRITRYITVERLRWLEWNSLPGIEYDKILLLAKMFPGRTLMEMKDIVFPLYQEWRKTAIFAPKMNRWQKMKQFATEYAGLL